MADVGDAVATPAGGTTRRLWLGPLKFLVVAVVVYFFVLPLIPGFREALDQLGKVDAGLLLGGLALEVAALVCYAHLTRSALGEESSLVSSMRVFRIQLSTKALGNVLPGGSAASSALGYRLLTMSGVRGADAGFALATAGLGSALILNVILWFGLIVSIPTKGVNPVYGTAAIAGVLLMGFAAVLVFGLVEGQGRVERLVRAIARRLRLDEQRAAEVLRHLGGRIEALWGDRQILRRVMMWATLNWVLDALALWVFLRAFGASLSPVGLIVAFGLANILSVIPVTPGGLGIVEGIYIPTLVGFGLTRTDATLGVLAYRVAQFWLPILLGWLAYLSLRYGPFSIDRRHELPPLPDEAETARRGRFAQVDWVEEFAPIERRRGPGSGEPRTDR